MKKIIIPILAVVIVVTAIVIAVNKDQGLGSIQTGHDYYSTTTPAGGAWTDQRIDGSFGNTGRWGSLGSVIVTSAGDQKFMLLDATSSLALTDVATSSVLITEINTANVGTYVFDVAFTTGLFLDVVSGDTGSTTITFR